MQSSFYACHRRCARDCADVDVNGVSEEREQICAVVKSDGRYETRHNARPAQKQEDTSGDCRVCEIFADAAKEHLDDDDCKESAHDRHVKRHDGRQIEREYHTRNDRRQIAHALKAFADDVEKPFRENASADAQNHHAKRIKSVKQDACNRRGDKRDDDVEHHLSRGERG